MLVHSRDILYLDLYVLQFSWNHDDQQDDKWMLMGNDIIVLCYVVLNKLEGSPCDLFSHNRKTADDTAPDIS